MERMGDILARTARIRARRGRLSSTSAPQQATDTAQPAQATTPPLARVTPRVTSRMTPRAAQPQSATPPPTRATPRPDIAHQSIPPVDALDSERILELPARRAQPMAQPVAQAARITASLAYALAAEPPAQGAGSARRDQRPQPPATRPAQRPAQRGRPATTAHAAANRMSAGSSGMLSLGEAAQGYANALRSTSPSGDARGAGKAPARRASATRPPVDPDVCPHCHGAGYVRLDVSVGDPAFGQAVACSCKERILEERRMSDLRRMSSLDAFRDKTFATFDDSFPGMHEAMEVAQRYAEDPHGWLVLSGGYGVGKTHLAAAIAHERLASGQSVFFSIVPDLLDHLRAAFAPSSEMPYDELFDKVREAGVLVLDDLGAENATAWATEKLFQIINYRYNYRMPTVVTTNNRLLSHMDERIRSRLSDMSFVRNVVIDAADYRERHAGRPRQAGQRTTPRTTRGAYQR